MAHALSSSSHTRAPSEILAPRTYVGHQVARLSAQVEHVLHDLKAPRSHINAIESSNIMQDGVAFLNAAIWYLEQLALPRAERDPSCVFFQDHHVVEVEDPTPQERDLTAALIQLIDHAGIDLSGAKSFFDYDSFTQTARVAERKIEELTEELQEPLASLRARPITALEVRGMQMLVALLKEETDTLIGDASFYEKGGINHYTEAGKNIYLDTALRAHRAALSIVTRMAEDHWQMANVTLPSESARTVVGSTNRSSLPERHVDMHFETLATLTGMQKDLEASLIFLSPLVLHAATATAPGGERTEGEEPNVAFEISGPLPRGGHFEVRGDGLLGNWETGKPVVRIASDVLTVHLPKRGIGSFSRSRSPAPYSFKLVHVSDEGVVTWQREENFSSLLMGGSAEPLKVTFGS